MKNIFYILCISLLLSQSLTFAAAKNEVTVTVFHDQNRDGVQQKNEKIISGAKVHFRHSGEDGIFKERKDKLRPQNDDKYYTKKTNTEGLIKMNIPRGVLYFSVDPKNFAYAPKEEQKMRVNYDGKKESFSFGVIPKTKESTTKKPEEKKEDSEKENNNKKKVKTEKETGGGLSLNSAPEEKPRECSFIYNKCDLGNEPGFLKYAQDLACEGVIKKRENCNEYKCDRNVTRAEVAAMGVKMRGIEIEPDYKCTYKFSDITKQHAPWICKTAEIAEKNGISWVNKDTLKFTPDTYYNRANSIGELMKAVCMPVIHIDDIQNFSENLKYTEWQKRVIRTAQKYNLTSRSDKDFNPTRKIKRQELFVVASKLLEWAESSGGCREKKMCK